MYVLHSTYYPRYELQNNVSIHKASRWTPTSPSSLTVSHCEYSRILRMNAVNEAQALFSPEFININHNVQLRSRTIQPRGYQLSCPPFSSSIFPAIGGTDVTSWQPHDKIKRGATSFAFFIHVLHVAYWMIGVCRMTRRLNWGFLNPKDNSPIAPVGKGYPWLTNVE